MKVGTLHASYAFRTRTFRASADSDRHPRSLRAEHAGTYEYSNVHQSRQDEHGARSTLCMCGDRIGARTGASGFDADADAGTDSRCRNVGHDDGTASGARDGIWRNPDELHQGAQSGCDALTRRQSRAGSSGGDRDATRIRSDESASFGPIALVGNAHDIVDDTRFRHGANGLSTANHFDDARLRNDALVHDA